MAKPIQDLTDSELVAAMVDAPTLEQLSDGDVLAALAEQGYLSADEANAAVVEKKRQQRAPEAEAKAAMLAVSTAGSSVPLPQPVAAALLTRGGRVGDVAAGVLAPIMGSIGGSAAGGLPGLIAGGSAGGTAGDALKQTREYFRGERDEMSTGELVTAAIAGGVPLGKAVPGKPLQMIVRRGLQGAGIAAGAEATGQLIDTGTVDLGRLAQTGALGLLFGGGVGAVESAALRKQVLRAIRKTPEFAEFAGTDAELVAAVRTRMAAAPEPRAAGTAEPVNVTTAPAEPAVGRPALTVGGDAPAMVPAAGIGPDGAPGAPPVALASAQTEFETRAGMRPPSPGETAAGSPAPSVPAAGVVTAEAPAAGPRDLSGLSDEQLLTALKSSVAVENAAPATSETSPAPTPEGVSGSIAGQGAPESAAESAGGQATPIMATPSAPVKSKGARLGVGAAADGSMDLLSLVEAEGGVRPPSAVRNAGGEYDGFAGAFSVGPARLLRSKTGAAVDVLMQRLEANHGIRFDSPDAFYSAIGEAAQSRDQVRRAIVKQEYEGKVAAALFQNAGRKAKLNAKAPIDADALKVGESMRIRGELYAVAGVDENTAEVTLKGGATLKVPAGTPLYPDNGEVLPAPAAATGVDVPFDLAEPRVRPWNAGLAAGNRYADLSAKLVGGSITPTERAELAAFEAGAGQGYVPGSMDASAMQADRARAAADAAQRARQELQAGSARRIVAPDLPTQKDLFGPAIGDTGSLFEPGHIELPYGLSRNPGGNRTTAGDVATSGESRRVSAAGGERDIGVDPGTYLADPIGNAGPLAAALREHGRVSSIVADYFAGALPAWSPVGKLIRSAADVGALMAPLRNPYAESYKVVVVDAMNRVQHAEVVHVGVLNAVNASLATVLRVVKKTNATRVILSHNHPSGDPTPSSADWRVHEQMRERLFAHGVELVDDVVTDGHAAYSLRGHTLVEMEHATPAPWEKVARRNLTRLNSAETVARLSAELRQGNSESAFVMYVASQGELTALEQVPAEVARFEEHALLSLIEAGVAREGAAYVIVAAHSVPPQTVKLLEDKLRGTVQLQDVVTDLQGSYFANGGLTQGTHLFRAAAKEAPGVVREAPAEYGDFEPDAPLIVRAAGGSGYAKVRLAGLPNIKIVQMPELVRLVRELTGSLPELKKLGGGTRGHFDSGAQVVRLDPRIFRDQVAAAKTLAHELGHLVDFLDTKTLKRGNLLGRLHSLRSFLANTFGAAAVTNKELRAELIAVTQWWKPYGPGAKDWYVKYRESAVELYADALSVLFNSPAELKARAPRFWAEFFAHLDKKPETKATLLETWDFLNQPHLQTLNRRSEDIRKMFVAGDEIWLRKAAEREARHANFRGWSDRFRQEIFDIFDPVVRRGAKLEKAGAKIPRGINPRLVFDEHPLAADNANYRMLQRLWEDVVKPVEAEQFTLQEVGEYMLLQRVLTEKFDAAVKTVGRAELANPLGLTPETARLGLLRMRLQAGWQRFARLEAAAAKFHDIVFERVQAAVDAGVYSRKTFDEVLAPNKGTYATFAVLDHLQDYVPAGLRMQQGTFKEIANPFTATVLKTISLNRLIQLNAAKQSAADFLTQFDPGTIAAAPRSFDGQRWHVQRPKDGDQVLLELLQDGAAAGYHVEPAVAEMFDGVTPATASAIVQVLQWPFRNIVYPLIIKYNPAFQLIRNPLRDARRSFINVPRALGIKNAAQALANYGGLMGLPKTEAAEAVRAYLAGEPHPLIAEMIARQAIGTPFDNFAVDLYRGDKWEQILREFGLLPAEQQKSWRRAVLRPAAWLGERLEFAGLTFEMLPKVSTYKILTKDLGWHAQEAAYFVRNNVGTPNLWRKGKHVVIADQVLPFLKIMLNGLRADVGLAKSPKTAGGWWLRWAMSDGLPTMLQAAAALGLLGAGIKELYDGISEYNKATYNVLPIGTVEGGQYGKRVMYLRFPRDDMHRMMSGLLYEGVMAMGGEANKEGLGSVLEFGSDQLPGLNPVLKIASAWQEFLEGQNPMDGYRGRQVLSNAEWLAGGWPAYKGMLGFTLQNAGVSNWIKYDPTAANAAEMTLSAVPGLNTFLQTTDAGYRERQERGLNAEARQRAQLRVSMPANVQALLSEYYWLNSVKAPARTMEQTQRLMLLRSWRTRIYTPYEDVASAELGFGRSLSPGTLRALETASAAFERGK